MTNWILKIVQLASASHHHQILLSDPDKLTDYPAVRTALTSAGYEVVTPSAPLKVRIYFELELRGNPKRKALLIAPSEYQALPDMARHLHVVTISLQTLFPRLHPAPLQGLSEVALARLFSFRVYEQLGEDATFHLVFEQLYQIDVNSLGHHDNGNRIAQALAKINQHPLGTTSVLQSYLSKFSTPAFQQLHERLLDMEKALSHLEQTPNSWLELMPTLAQLTNAVLDWPDNGLHVEWQALIQRVNEKFQAFLDLKYDGLATLSAKKHPMVVSRLLDYIRGQALEKTALIVLDGMNFWQADLLVEYLQTAGLSVQAKATMAFIPTITAWSRQAIFRGSEPDTATDNRQEMQLFKQYWQRYGVHPHQIHYHKFTAAKPLSPDTISPDITRLALVCNDLDELLHSVTNGYVQLRSATQNWLNMAKLSSLIHTLQEQGFRCYITADHGSVEAVGVKMLSPAQKVGVHSRSKRHARFENQTLLATFLAENAALALGQRDLSVYLRDSSAFTASHERVITHGGSHVWEVVVPLLEI